MSKKRDHAVKAMEFYRDFPRKHTNALSLTGNFPYRTKLQEIWTMHAEDFINGQSSTLTGYATTMIDFIVNSLKKSNDPNAAAKVESSRKSWMELFADTTNILGQNTSINGATWAIAVQSVVRLFCAAHYHTSSYGFRDSEVSHCETNLTEALKKYGTYLIAYATGSKTSIMRAQIYGTSLEIANEMSKLKKTHF